MTTVHHALASSRPRNVRSLRRRLAEVRAVVWNEWIECRPGCTNGWDQMTSCAECRELEFQDRAAW